MTWTAAPASGWWPIIDNEYRGESDDAGDDIKRIKATVTVDDVLARYVATPLRRVAKGRAGACPICGAGNNKKSRAFTVSADGRAWYCFGDCRRGGSVIDLVALLQGETIADAIARLARL